MRTNQPTPLPTDALSQMALQAGLTPAQAGRYRTLVRRRYNLSPMTPAQKTELATLRTLVRSAGGAQS